MNRPVQKWACPEVNEAKNGKSSRRAEMGGEGKQAWREAKHVKERWTRMGLHHLKEGGHAV